MQAGTTRTKFVLVLVLLSALSLSTVNVSGQNFWTRTDGPYGAYVLASVTTVKGLVFVGTGNGRIHRSANNGDSWVPTSLDLASSITALGSNAQGHVLVGSFGDGFYRSVDDGNTWVRRPAPRISSFAVNSTGHIYAASPGGLIRSLDNGDTWASVGVPSIRGGVSSVVIGNSDAIFTVSNFGLYRSIDNGATWTTPRSAPSDSAVDPTVTLAVNSDGYVFASTLSGLLRTVDGENWTWSHKVPGVLALAVDKASNELFIGFEAQPVLGSSTVLRSRDGGVSWQPLNVDLEHRRFSSIAIGANGVIFVGTVRSGVVRSLDGGTSWTEANDGMIDFQISALVANASNQIFAGNNQGGGVYRSTDRGVTWRQVNAGLAGVQVISARGRTAATVVSLVVNSRGHLFAGTSDLGVFRSTDNGNSWVPVNSGVATTGISLAVNSKDQLFAGSGSGMLRSLDNGASWTTINSGLTNVFVRAVAVNASDHVFAGTFGGGAYRSLDNGATWTQINSGLTNLFIQSIVIDSQGSVLVGTVNARVFKSTDNGASWRQVLLVNPPGEIQALAKGPDDQLFAGTARSGVYRSTDGGETWTAVTAGLTDLNVRALTVDGNGYVYTATLEGAVHRSAAPTATSSEVPFSLVDRGGVSWTSSGASAAIQVGHASVQPSAGSTTPAGLAIFGYRQNNVLVGEAGVPASRLIQSGRIFAEVTSTINTGLAIANPNSQSATVTFFFTGPNGNFGNGTLTIPPNGQVARFLNEAPYSVGASVSGTFTFSSSLPIAVVALRGLTNERAEFLVTTLPVADLTVPVASGPLVVPHFVQGGGWSTEIILVNSSDSVLPGAVQFLNPSGAASVVEVDGQTASSFPYSLPARSAVKMKTSGSGGSVQSGSVLVTPGGNSASPSALSVFSFRNAGVTVAEAGVPAVTTGNAFRLYTERAASSSAVGAIQTGVAVANTSPGTATVTIELTRLDGSPTGLAGTLQIPANGHTAAFVEQIAGLTTLPAFFQGVLRVTSAAAISVVGLRGRYNERGDFLITTLPVSSEASPPATAPVYFPHIVDSGGYTTQFILFSGGSGQNSSGTMQLLSTSGTPLRLTFVP